MRKYDDIFIISKETSHMKEFMFVFKQCSKENETGPNEHMLGDTPFEQLFAASKEG